nr:TipAS antibiotic-recognition domain-containing protein [Amycolatopsis rubida]
MQLTAEQQVEIFGSEWNPEWVDEAAERWGGTKQWAEYRERTTELTPRDWQEAAAEHETLHADLAAARRAGVEPGSAEANTLAERHRATLSRYFDCTHSMQVCLGRKFVEETGYAEYYDALAPGLAGWLRDVIFANAIGQGVDPATAVWE